MGKQCCVNLKLMVMALRYHLCTISAPSAAYRGGTRAWWKLVPFGEIVINPSDLKHVVELLGCSYGLGVVITTRAHLWDAV